MADQNMQAILDAILHMGTQMRNVITQQQQTHLQHRQQYQEMVPSSGHPWRQAQTMLLTWD